MQLEHEDRTGGGSAAQPSASRDHRFALSGSSRAGFDPARLDAHSEREAAGRAGAGAAGVPDLTRADELVVGSERQEEVLFVSLSGELDLAGSALLERELDAAETGRRTRVNAPQYPFRHVGRRHSLGGMHQTFSVN